MHKTVQLFSFEKHIVHIYLYIYISISTLTFVMQQNTKTDSLNVKTYLAKNLFLFLTSLFKQHSSDQSDIQVK